MLDAERNEDGEHRRHGERYDSREHSESLLVRYAEVAHSRLARTREILRPRCQDQENGEHIAERAVHEKSTRDTLIRTHAKHHHVLLLSKHVKFAAILQYGGAMSRGERGQGTTTTTTTTAHDTGDGFLHVWVPGNVLSVDCRPRNEGKTCAGARVASVRAAAFVNRVCNLRRPRDEGATQALMIWRSSHSDARAAWTSSASARYTREPHAGEPALVFVRGDGVAVIEITTHLVSFDDWEAVRDRISGAIESIALRDLPTPSSLVGMVAWTHEILKKERVLARLVDRIVQEHACENLRKRFATRAIASALDANMEAIKVKLWHPDGRLVTRMIHHGEPNA